MWEGDFTPDVTVQEFQDNKTTLEASDDAATVNIGHHSQYPEELTNEYGKGFSARSLRLCR